MPFHDAVGIRVVLGSYPLSPVGWFFSLKRTGLKRVGFYKKIIKNKYLIEKDFIKLKITLIENVIFLLSNFIFS